MYSAKASSVSGVKPWHFLSSPILFALGIYQKNSRLGFWQHDINPSRVIILPFVPRAYHNTIGLSHHTILMIVLLEKLLISKLFR
jgi:hypothetical protein